MPPRRPDRQAVSDEYGALPFSISSDGVILPQVEYLNTTFGPVSFSATSTATVGVNGAFVSDAALTQFDVPTTGLFDLMTGWVSLDAVRSAAGTGAVFMEVYHVASGLVVATGGGSKGYSASTRETIATIPWRASPLSLGVPIPTGSYKIRARAESQFLAGAASMVIDTNCVFSWEAIGFRRLA